MSFSFVRALELARGCGLSLRRGMDFGCSAKATFRLTTYPGIVLGPLH